MLIVLVTFCLYFSRSGNEKRRHFDLKFLEMRVFLTNETFSVQTADWMRNCVKTKLVCLAELKQLGAAASGQLA